MKKSSSARADLHIYTRHSTRAADWILRRLDFPASYTDPKALYAQLKAAGMDYVTVTDQDTLDGYLEIADLPGVFSGVEVQASFPGDDCKVHMLVWGLNEEQHRAIQALRKNVFELQAYLAASGLAHAVAHPLHGLNDALTPAHFEKLVLLFRHFEVINGRFQAQVSETARFCLSKLTPQALETFANRHGLAPTHPDPWKKVFVGGSDDHGGVFPGRAWTEVAACGSSEEFLAAVKSGNCSAGGENGTSLTLAHGIYSTAFYFAKDRLAPKSNEPAIALVEKVFSRFMEGKDPTEFTFVEKFGFLAQGIASGKIFEMAKVGNSSVWKELSRYFSQPEVKAAMAKATAGVKEPERRAFLMANLLANQLSFRLFTQFITQVSAGKFLESLQLISPLVPIVALLSPYLYAFRHPRRSWLRGMSLDACGEIPPALQNQKRAWFTDTLEDVNGVATTIQRMTAAGVAAGRDLTVVTSRSEVAIQGIPIKNFQPIGEFELPEYELQRLSFPPILDILDWIEQENFGEIIISTPGPVGLVALLAAKLMGLRAVGIYHTDFPQYVRILTDDSFMETLTWNYMHWFYSQLDLVYVNSEDYRKCWADRGISDQKLRILPRGLDTELFQPTRRDESFWKARGLQAGEIGMLFVGRVSREKKLDLLVESLMAMDYRKYKIRPLFVGDGPFAAELKKLLPDGIFTGYLAGEDLAKAYASADFFVFPSTTDTFGNVILEAHASGIPTIVSDQGGPRDLVTHGEDGLITKALDRDDLAKAIRQMAESPESLRTMGQAARAKVETRDWSKAFEQFWADSPE